MRLAGAGFASILSLLLLAGVAVTPAYGREARPAEPMRCCPRHSEGLRCPPWLRARKDCGPARSRICMYARPGVRSSAAELRLSMDDLSCR